MGMTVKLICFGDSNTWGYDPRGYFGGRYDHPWPDILAGKLHCTVINQGENGREIPTEAVFIFTGYRFSACDAWYQ